MRKESISILVLVCLLLMPLSVQAANVGGEFVSELRLPIKQDEPVGNTTATLGAKIAVDGEFGDLGDWKLTLDLSFDEKLNNFKSNIWKGDDTDQMGEAVTLELGEAYLNLYSVGYDALDFRLGKQHVDMGVGDGITTFHLIKPVAANFIDELQNTRAVTGVKVDGYPGDYHVELFLQPKVTPTKIGGAIAAVYEKTLTEAMMPMLDNMGEAHGVAFAHEFDLSCNPPAYKDDGLGWTLKATTLVEDYDVSVIYQRGYVSSPMISDYDKQLVGFNPEKNVPIMQLQLEQGYLPLQKIGFTVEGAVGDVGVWSEVTYNIPKKGFFGEGFNNPLIPEEYKFTDENYVTGLIGADYFLENGVYINGQLVRGFPQEVTKNMINTYLVGNVSQDFLNNRLTLEGSMVYSFGEKGWILLPEAVYQVNSNTKVMGRLAIPGGGEDSLFKKMGDLTQVLIGVSVGF